MSCPDENIFFPNLFLLCIHAINASGLQTRKSICLSSLFSRRHRELFYHGISRISNGTKDSRNMELQFQNVGGHAVPWHRTAHHGFLILGVACLHSFKIGPRYNIKMTKGGSWVYNQFAFLRCWEGGLERRTCGPSS